MAQTTTLKARYRFSSLHKLESVTVRGDQPLILIDRPDLTASIGFFRDDFTPEIDEGRAVAFLFFSNLKALNAITSSDVVPVMRDIRRAREEHIRQNEHVLMVHTTRDIELEVDPGNPPFEVAGWTVGATIPTSSNVLDGHGSVFGRVVTAASLAIEQPLRVSIIDQGLFVFDTEGRKFLNVTFKFRANAVIGVGSEKFASFGQRLNQLENRPDLTRIVAVDAQSSESEDRMRAWLLAWTALEMFIHKRFRRYQADFDKDLRAPSTVGDSLVDDHLAFVSEVLQGRFSLLAKFRIVAARLCPKTAVDDVKLFVDLKKQRDDVIHGADVFDRYLRTDEIQALCRRYVEADLRQGK